MPDDVHAPWSPIPDWADAAIRRASLTVEPIRPRAQRMVSGDIEAFLSKAPGADLHRITANEISEAPSYAVPLGPDRVLAVDEAADGPAGALATGWHDDGYAVSDMTDGFIVFRIEGAGAAALISSGCSLPLGRGGETRNGSGTAWAVLSGHRVVLLQGPDLSAFRVHVTRDFAPDLWQWMRLVAGTLE